MNRVRRRPRVIAKRRAYQRCNPRCTRVLRGQATRKCLFAGISAKPSDGLEPSTPSLPSRSRAGTAGKAGKPRARKAGQEEGIGRRRVAAGGRSCPECCSVSVPSTKLAGDRIRRACRRVNAAAVRGRSRRATNPRARRPGRGADRDAARRRHRHQPALAYCEQLVQRPNDTILVLVSDLMEGGDERALCRGRLSDRAARALSDDSAPAYDHEHAQGFAALGIPTFA
jgi:hypothetical protein